jgi:hypothetical protein
MIKGYRFQVKSYTSFQNNKNCNFKSNSNFTSFQNNKNLNSNLERCAF